MWGGRSVDDKIDNLEKGTIYIFLNQSEKSLSIIDRLTIQFII